MPLFLSDEELQTLRNDAVAVADKADAFIRDLYAQLDTARAQAEAAPFTADHKVDKDGEAERLSTEMSDLHKSKRQLMTMLEQKESEISEKNSTIQSYLDKIVNLTEKAAEREARLCDAEAELVRSQATCERLLLEKGMIERHNVWLDEQLTAETDSLMELRKKHAELEAEMSAKLRDVEKQRGESSNFLNWYKERVSELEMKLTSLQEISKLAELYKESSDEWSKKAGEHEGVIKALETHISQLQNEHKEKTKKEEALRREAERETAELRAQLVKCEAEIESNRKGRELSIPPLSRFSKEGWVDSFDSNDNAANNLILGPSIPSGVSGTALAASLLKELAKMYAKYQEAVDALRHEQMGRKQSQAVLERVLREIEEKASVILGERAEHETIAEAYAVIHESIRDCMKKKAEHDEEAASKVAAVLERAEESSQKLTMEVSMLKQEKELIQNSERRACNEFLDLSERVHRLQASLDAMHTAEHVREVARGVEMKKLDKLQKEWAEAKQELHLERDNTIRDAMTQIEQMRNELANALQATPVGASSSPGPGVGSTATGSASTTIFGGNTSWQPSNSPVFGSTAYNSSSVFSFGAFSAATPSSSAASGFAPGMSSASVPANCSLAGVTAAGSTTPIFSFGSFSSVPSCATSSAFGFGCFATATPSSGFRGLATAPPSFPGSTNSTISFKMPARTSNSSSHVTPSPVLFPSLISSSGSSAQSTFTSSTTTTMNASVPAKNVGDDANGSMNAPTNGNSSNSTSSFAFPSFEPGFKFGVLEASYSDVKETADSDNQQVLSSPTVAATTPSTPSQPAASALPVSSGPSFLNS